MYIFISCIFYVLILFLLLLLLLIYYYYSIIIITKLIKIKYCSCAKPFTC